jgi:L-cysteine/cystine lyase
MRFEEARAQFPVLERLAYLNAGSNGPLPRAATEAVVAEAERDLRLGRSSKTYIDRLLERRGEARRQLAAVLDVDPANVALVESTSRGCALVLAGLGLGAGDEVVTTTEEHFGLLGPLHASGARVVVTSGDEESLVAAVTPRTRLVATSHVLWTTGRRLDLARVREEAGVPLLVDGAQSAGAIASLGAEAFDFYTVSAQKWLCAPEPTGALYVREPERLRVASPGYLAQTAYEPTGAFTPREGAARFDSWFGAPTLAGLLAALEAHPTWRYERSAEAAARCRELLAEHVEVVTPPGHSTLVSFRPPGDPTELVATLEERGVIVRELPGRNLVRASCGWWTSDEDLERLAEGVLLLL